MHEIYLKLTIKAPEQCHWRLSGVFDVDIEQISSLIRPEISLLTVNK